MLQRLNYQHLHYFWAVASEGSVTAAAATLRVSPSTVSVQLKALEAQFERALFERAGRGIRLTETGKVAFKYAESIFSTGRELENYLLGHQSAGAFRLDVGIAQMLPKLVTWTLIAPATRLEQPCHVVCREAQPAELISSLLLHQLDVVLTDVPLTGGTSVKLFNRLLGQSTVSFYARPALARRCRGDLAEALRTLPVLLPSAGTEMRRSLDAFFGQLGVHPLIAAEFDDLALLEVAGGEGLGLFPIPDVVSAQAEQRYRVKRVGTAHGVVERFYATSADRKIQNPAVHAIVGAAKALLTGKALA